MGRTSVVMRGRGRHMVFVVVHALQVDHTRQTRACVGRTMHVVVGWGGTYAKTHRLRTVAIPTIARDERQETGE